MQLKSGVKGLSVGLASSVEIWGPGFTVALQELRVEVQHCPKNAALDIDMPLSFSHGRKSCTRTRIRFAHIR